MMKILRQTSAVVALCLIALFSFSAQAANLIAFIVADTYDDSVGSSVGIDFDNVRQEMNNVSQYTGLSLKEVLIQGKANTTQNFIQTLKSLSPNKEDVLVFFYAGHGYRTPSKGNNPWPNLVFTQEKGGQHKGIDYQYIIYQLMEKKPRLLITIADVCNDLLSDRKAPPVVTKMWASAPNVEKIRANYKHLYLDEAGMINITAATMGETAAGDEDDGGVFTKAFLDSMKFETANATPANWRALIERASAKVTEESILYAKQHGTPLDRAEKEGEIQHPYFQIITKNSASPG